jgi:hypothetical protein
MKIDPKWIIEAVAGEEVPLESAVGGKMIDNSDVLHLMKRGMLQLTLTMRKILIRSLPFAPEIQSIFSTDLGCLPD